MRNLERSKRKIDQRPGSAKTSFFFLSVVGTRKTAREI